MKNEEEEFPWAAFVIIWGLGGLAMLTILLITVCSMLGIKFSI